MSDCLAIPTVEPFKIDIAGTHTVGSGWTFPHRVIDNYMLLFMQTGSIEISEGDHSFSVHKGQSLIFFPGRRHGGARSTCEKITYYWLHFTLAEHLAGHSGEVMEIPQQSRPRHPEIIADYLRRFISYQAMGHLHSRQCQFLLMLILSEVAYQKEDPSGTKRNVFATMAMNYITHHIFPMSTAQIAKSVGCNPDYLGRVFKQTYGVTISQAIRRQCIILARQQLHVRNIPIYQTAMNCGFEDPAYFCRIFKKHTGMTPLEYRCKHSQHHIVRE